MRRAVILRRVFFPDFGATGTTVVGEEIWVFKHEFYGRFGGYFKLDNDTLKYYSLFRLKLSSGFRLSTAILAIGDL